MRSAVWQLSTDSNDVARADAPKFLPLIEERVMSGAFSMQRYAVSLSDKLRLPHESPGKKTPKL